MGGKYIYYSHYGFQQDPNDPKKLIKTDQLNADKCPPRPNSQYYCTYLAYRNYANTKYLTFDLGIDKAPPGYEIINRKMNIHIFNFIIEGKGVFNGKPFGKGSFYYSKAHQVHTMIADKNEPWISVWFAIDGTMGKKIADRLDERYADQMGTFSHPDDLLRLTEVLLYDFPHIQSSTEYIEGVLHLMMSYLFPDKDYAFDENREFTLHQQKLIRQSMITIERNLATVTVASLAKEAHLETKYYSRIFAAVTGISPKEYLLRVKTETAAHYLANTTYAVEDITAMLGYKHRNSLNAAFKSAFGMNPSEYRKNQSEKK